MAPLGDGGAPMLHVGIRQQEPYGLKPRNRDVLPLSLAQRRGALLHAAATPRTLLLRCRSPLDRDGITKKIYARLDALGPRAVGLHPPAGKDDAGRLTRRCRAADNVAPAGTAMHAVPDTFEHRSTPPSWQAPCPPRGRVSCTAQVHRAPRLRAAHPRGLRLGAIEAGVERFRYRGEDHLAPADTLVLMNPDELHTGCAGRPSAGRYRMVVPRRAGCSSSQRRARLVVRRRSGAATRLRAARRPTCCGSSGIAQRAASPSTRCCRIWSTSCVRPRAAPRRRATFALPRFAAVIDQMRAAWPSASRSTSCRRWRAFRRSTSSASSSAPTTPARQQMLMALRLFESEAPLAAGDMPADVAAAWARQTRRAPDLRLRAPLRVTPAALSSNVPA